MAPSQNGNLDAAIQQMKRELDQSGLRKALALKSIPKRSLRLRQKALLSQKRKKREERKQERGKAVQEFDIPNLKKPWFRFSKDGNKIYISRREMRQ